MADDNTLPTGQPESLPESAPAKERDPEERADQGPPVVEPEVMESLPPEVRREVRQFMAMSTQVGPRPHPLAGKITPEHITQIIKVGEGDSQREREDAKESRRYAMGYVVLFCVLFVFVTVFLAKSNTALYEEILKLLVVFLGGVGGGFGAKSFLDRKKGAQ